MTHRAIVINNKLMVLVIYFLNSLLYYHKKILSPKTCILVEYVVPAELAS